MPNRKRQPSLRQALHNVYWIGGGTGAGKSTIAKKIAEEYNLKYYSTDQAMKSHAQRCHNCPYLESFKTMSMDERWVHRSPKEMLDTFHWFRGEAFELIIEDILNMLPNGGIIAEGFRLLPTMVKPLLENINQSIWLIPTPTFQFSAFTQRGSLWQIPQKTNFPYIALQNILERDRLFTENLHTELTSLQLPTIHVSKDISQRELFSRVTNHFFQNAV